MRVQVKSRNQAGLAGLALGAPLLIATALLLRGFSGPGPSLEEVRDLIRARRFDEAESLLRARLGRAPGTPEAHVLMAVSSLSRPIPRPEVALDHLRQVRQAPHLMATVRLNEARAYYSLDLFDKAEAAWLDALGNPAAMAEAGSNLLGLYYLQGRSREARSLALSLHSQERDPRQRVLWLLELVRQDARPLDPDSQAVLLEPVVRKNLSDVRTAVALAIAYIQSSRPDQGIALLRRVIEDYPEDLPARIALLDATATSSPSTKLEESLDRLPGSIAGDPWIDFYRGQIAEARYDWPAATRFYRRAREVNPGHTVLCYRLSQLLRRTGDREGADRFLQFLRSRESAAVEVRSVFREAIAVPTLGTAPHPDLYQRIAALRERMGCNDEALAWHRLTLRDRPDDPLSRAAVERLAGAPAPTP
jgi:tetratricopeptide (TPR) repeat protein